MLTIFLYFGFAYALAGWVFGIPESTMKRIQKEPRNPRFPAWFEFCLRLLVLMIVWALWPFTGLWAALMPKGWK